MAMTPSSPSCGGFEYHDFSKESPSDSLTLLSKDKTGSESNFPVKLHYMLSDMEGDGLDHIVSWQPHGRSFTVNKPKEFVEKILPLWFRQSKLSSFQRQLNLYGFKRITQGRDKGAHYHELFLRGKRDLAHRIPRMKIKGGGPRKSARPSEEPNFYIMPYLPSCEKVENSQKDVYNTATPTMDCVARTSSVNQALEQALVHRAYLKYTSQNCQANATPTFSPLPSPPTFPSPATARVPAMARTPGLGFHQSIQDFALAAQDRTDSQVLAALQEKEMITAALLQRLRSPH